MSKRTLKQWQSLFSAHRQSGLSIAAFCKANGLCNKHFSHKRRQLEQKGDAISKAATPFVRATRTVPSPERSIVAPAAIRWRGVYGELSFPLSVTPEWLAAFVKALA